MEVLMGIILLVASVFLVIAVLMQSGKSHNLSGSIAGGAETFFGKTKGKAIDKMLSKVTTVVAIVFVVLVIVVYVIQPVEYVDTDKWFKENFDSSVEDTATEETTIGEAETDPVVDDANDEVSDEDIFDNQDSDDVAE